MSWKPDTHTHIIVCLSECESAGVGISGISVSVRQAPATLYIMFYTRTMCISTDYIMNTPL